MPDGLLERVATSQAFDEDQMVDVSGLSKFTHDLSKSQRFIFNRMDET